jgi:hypothetical protein
MALFNTSKETISLKEIVLDSLMSDLNFDICREHFYGIMAEIPAFKLRVNIFGRSEKWL